MGACRDRDGSNSEVLVTFSCVMEVPVQLPIGGTKNDRVKVSG